MLPQTIEFTLGRETYRIEPNGSLRAAVLRSVPSEATADGTPPTPWPPTRDIVLRATYAGQVFPPLVGPLPDQGIADSAACRALHLFPATASVITANGPYRANPGPPPFSAADILVLACRLLEEIRGQTADGDYRLSDCCDDLGFLYVPARRLWLLPAPVLVRELRPPGAAAAGQMPETGAAAANARACGRILQQLLAGVEKDAAPADRPVLSWLRQQIAGGAASPTADIGALAGLLHDAVTRLGVAVPSLAGLPLPRCLHCRAGLKSAVEECPNPDCRRPLPRFHAYRRLDQHWLYHPAVGRKRFRCLRADRFPNPLPLLPELNALLEGVDEARIIDRFVTDVQVRCPTGQTRATVVVLVLDSAESDDSLLERRLQRILRPPTVAVPLPPARAYGIQSLKTNGCAQGLQCFWRHNCPRGTTFHVWWSRQPLPRGSWGEIAAAATGNATAHGNSHVIEVGDEGTLYVAVGAERAGQTPAICYAEAFVASRPQPAGECPAAAVPAVEVVAAPPVVCPACQTAVAPNRQFCTKCGSRLAPAAAVLPSAPTGAAAPAASFAGQDYEIAATREQYGDARRLSVRIDGSQRQMLDVESSAGLGELLEAVRGSPMAGLFAEIERQEQDPRRLRVLCAAEDGRLPLAQWCRQRHGDETLYAGLGGVMRQMLDALAALHSAGYVYGLLLADRVAVDADAGNAYLDWPLAPLRIGSPASGARVPLGFVCPEFGHAGEAAQGHWDLFALGVAVFFSLVGRCPPESLSDRLVPHCNLRILAPDLPAGWAGFFERLMAKSPAARFATAAAARDFLDGLLQPAPAVPLGYRVAAAQHVGATKVLSNPRNQDRCFFWMPQGTSAAAPKSGFDGFDPGDTWSTGEVAGGPLLWAAVSDGISTVDSGEFAAAEIVATLGAIGPQVNAADGDAGAVLAAAFDRTNVELGQAILRESGADGRNASFLHPSTSPSATLAAVLFGPGGAATACVGDSRLYLLRGGQLEQLTVDGDQFTVYCAQGLDARQASQRDDAKELVSWIGRYENDTGPGGTRIAPDRARPISAGQGFWCFRFAPRPGDVYVCCSDGLSDYVDFGRVDLAGALCGRPPAEACRFLVDAANACGGGDNISVVVIAVSATAAAATDATPL